MLQGLEFSDEFLRRALLNIYSKNFHPATEIEAMLFNAVWEKINKAAREGFDASGVTDPDKDFLSELQHNNAVFAAFKVHRMQNDMARLLLDSNGDLKPFTEWLNDVRPIASHQLGVWLRTEYDTAVLRAHKAADWQQFEREKDVLPNLKWIPSTSLHPGLDHRVYWNTVRPVDDPFWSSHRPGDRWNCKCDLTSTDEPVTQIPDDTEGKSKPQPGLDNNPGKDAQLFNDSHPYFPSDCNHCPLYKAGRKKNIRNFFINMVKDCYNCPYLNACIDRAKEVKSQLRIRAKEIRKEAAHFKNEHLINSDFKHDVTVSEAGIKEWLNQPHKHFREKNEMLLEIDKVFRKAEYIGYNRDSKERQNVVWSHIFEIEISGDKSWIVVHEMDWGEFKLHGVSDGESITTGIKKGGS